jgi:transposase
MMQHMDRLVNALLIGATYELAAQYAGISHDTFSRWRKKAATAKPGTPEAVLRERLSEAEARAAIGWLAKIEQAASDGNWQAAAWKLERRYPETYGRTGVQKLAFTDVTGEHSTMPQLQIVLSQEPTAPALPPPAIDVEP